MDFVKKFIQAKEGLHAMDSKVLDVMEAAFGEELGLAGELGTVEAAVIATLQVLGQGLLQRIVRRSPTGTKGRRGPVRAAVGSGSWSIVPVRFTPPSAGWKFLARTIVVEIAGRRMCRTIRPPGLAPSKSRRRWRRHVVCWRSMTVLRKVPAKSKNCWGRRSRPRPSSGWCIMSAGR